MPNLYIREYEGWEVDAYKNPYLAPDEPALKGQEVVFTTSTQSAAFLAATRIIRVVSDGDCFLDFGDNPTAAKADGLYLPQKTVEFYIVNPGQKLAVYDGTS